MPIEVAVKVEPEVELQEFFDLEVVNRGDISVEILSDAMLAPVDMLEPVAKVDKTLALATQKMTHPEILLKKPAAPEVKKLTVDELLAKFSEMGLKSIDDLNIALDALLSGDAPKNSVVVEQWIDTAKSSKQAPEVFLAEAFSKQNDLGAAFSQYRSYMSRTGSSESIFQVGMAQFFGRGTPVDRKAAVENLFRAWQGGHADAAYLYGVAQLEGLGVAKNPYQAYYTFNTAIDMGSKLAYREAARMQELGLGEKQNLYWSVHLYKQGAALGEPYCLLRLTEIYSSGENGLYTVNRSLAEAWAEKMEGVEESELGRLVRSQIPEAFYTKAIKRQY